MDDKVDAEQRLSRRPRGGGASNSKKDGAASPSSPFFVAQRVAGGEGSQKEQANRGSAISNTRTTVSERRATEVLGRSSQTQMTSQPGGPRASASADPSRWVQEQEQAVTLGAWQCAAEKIYDAAEEEHELTKLIVAKQEAETQTDYNAAPGALQTSKKAPGGAGGTTGAPAVAVPPLALSGSTSATPTQVNPAFTTALQKNKTSPRGGANASKVGATSTSSPRSGATNVSPRTANRTTEEQQKLRELDFHFDHEKDVGSVLGAAKLSPKGWETSLRGAGGGAAFSPRGAGGGAFSPRTMSTTYELQKYRTRINALQISSA